jgi:hypothetical protein
VVSKDDVAQVDLIRAAVYLDGPVSADEFAPDSVAEDPSGRAFDVIHEARDNADRAAQLLVEQLRVGGKQPWLALGDEPAVAVGDITIDDLDAGRCLPVSSTTGPIRILLTPPPDGIIDESRLHDVFELVRYQSRPPLAEALLADAVYYFQHATPADPARAVLIAAIACEVKVKSVLRARVKDDARDLLELTLENPRDFSFAARALFHEVSKAVIGHSLRDDDRPLYKRVVRLYEVRNDLAHRGVTPTIDVAEDCVRAAVQAARWLDQLPGPSDGEPR